MFEGELGRARQFGAFVDVFVLLARYVPLHRFMNRFRIFAALVKAELPKAHLEQKIVSLIVDR